MDANLSDYAGGASEFEKETIRQYRACLELSVDFVRPYFQKFTRFYRLFAGNRPPEADTTFSQVMLWYPYALIEKELPMSLKSYFSTPDWISLEASSYEKEMDAGQATAWLKYHLEKKQKFATSIIPTIQAAHIFGTGYRYYCPSPKKRISRREQVVTGALGIPERLDSVQDVSNEWVVNGRDISIFNVFPAPFGGCVNPTTENSEDAVDYLILQTWMTKEQIEAEVEKGNFNKQAAGLLLKTITDNSTDPANEFKEEILGTKSNWGQFSAPSWVAKMQENKTGVSRYRVAWFMRRNKWAAIGEDRFVLYDGKPRYDFFPIAKFVGSYNTSNWYGTGLIEPSEDLIISMILNFNHRMDYLAGSFHPLTFYPMKLVDDNGGDISILDPEPYKKIPYNHKQFPGGLGNYIFTQENKALNQQAFIEESNMRSYMEEITGQYSIQNLSGEGATTGQALITKDMARQMMRAINIENSGIIESAQITMKMNRQYMLEPEWIRQSNADGFPWSQIDPEVLDDDYGIILSGSKELEMGEANFRKMIAVAQYLLNNPAVRGQAELTKQLAERAGFRNIDALMIGDQSEDAMASAIQAQQPQAQGAPARSNVQNDVLQTMNSQMAEQGVLV